MIPSHIPPSSLVRSPAPAKRKYKKLLIQAVQHSDLLALQHLLGLEGYAQFNDHYLLRMASSQGKTDVVQCLLNHGFNATASDNFALRSASAAGHLEVVRLLLQAGGTLTAQHNGPLMMAIKHGRFAVVHYLLSHPSTFVHRQTLLESALQYALQNGQVPIGHLLIQRGAPWQDLLAQVRHSATDPLTLAWLTQYEKYSHPHDKDSP